MQTEHVSGTRKAKIMLYALSTCVWCRKTKDLLKDLGVEYEYAFVDLLPRSERSQALAEIARWNPAGSFPTLVIDDSTCIVGYKPDELKKRLGL